MTYIEYVKIIESFFKAAKKNKVAFCIDSPVSTGIFLGARGSSKNYDPKTYFMHWKKDDSKSEYIAGHSKTFRVSIEERYSNTWREYHEFTLDFDLTLEQAIHRLNEYFSEKELESI